MCMLGANSAGIGERRKKGKVKEEKGKRKEMITVSEKQKNMAS